MCVKGIKRRVGSLGGVIWFIIMITRDDVRCGNLTKWLGPTRGGVLVLDDLMEEGGQDKRVLDFFTKDSHHRNITVLYLTQD